MCHEATFSLTYADVEQSRRVAASLRPEVDDLGGERSRATVERDGDDVTITVEAADVVALRAGINTWLSLAGVAERAGGIAD